MKQFLLVALLINALASPAAAADPPPNIVIILADDLGYGDLQCYNPKRGKIPTPHIDRLASQGMLFTDAHSSSGVCSPSRYTLLTGRYHWRTRLQSGIVHYLERPLIASDRLTIARLLQQQGYHTACIGKWHLGWDWDIPEDQRKLVAPRRGHVPEVTDQHREAWKEVYSRPIAGGPTTRGFNEYFGTDVPNWPPYCFIKNDRTVGIPSEFLPKELLQNRLASLPGPALADWNLKNILPTIVDYACDYIKHRAKTGQPFFLYLPLTAPHTPIAVRDLWRGKSGLDSNVADFIMQTDAEVGRVLAALNESGAAENTLVIFTSDNGAAYYRVKNQETQGHYPSGPLRGYKTDAWEGGHRIPFIVRWPGIVKPDTECEQLVHQADIIATVAEILEATLPDDAAEDSVSLMPLLKGSREPIRKHAISQGTRGVFALRRGPWKMIFAPSGTRRNNRSDSKSAGHPAQLYNLAADIGETNNVYADHPKIVQEMTALLEKLVTTGRSTPGPAQENDVPVQWKRFLKSANN